MQMNHGILNEKYRPDTLENFIGNEDLISKAKEYISANDLPHLLLSGPPGVGKTTLAKILCNKIDCDSMYINASDERDIDTVRNKIQNYAACVGFKELKIIVLDEFDGMLPTSQRALRNIMETYSLDTRFILTCNQAERIIAPILSRVQHFELYPPSKNQVAKHLISILTQEGVEWEKEGIKTLVLAFYPDIRKIINEAQLHICNSKLTVDEEDIAQTDYKFKVFDLLQDDSLSNLKRLQAIRQIFADTQIRDYSSFYTFLYEKALELSEKNVSQIILHIADAQAKDALVPDKEINAAALICNLINTI